MFHLTYIVYIDIYHTYSQEPLQSSQVPRSPSPPRASQTHLFDGEPQEVREEAPCHVGSLRGRGAGT